MSDDLELPSMALHFELGGRSFGLPIELVRELLPATTLEPVPDAPPEMRGLIRVRGQLVPVLELRDRLDLDAQVAAAQIVVVERSGTTLGLLLECVHAVILAEDSEIRSASTPTDDSLVRGVLDHDGRLVTILSLAYYFDMVDAVMVDAGGMEAAHDEEQLQQLHLTLRVGGQRLALPVHRVQEILEYRGHTVVPRAPSCVTGVLNLRGAVIPVFPLAEALGLPATAPPTRVVVLEAHWNDELHLVGLLVENVEQVVPIDDRDVAPPPQFGMRLPQAYASGVLQHDSEPLFLLDADQVLDIDVLSAPESM